MPQIHLVLSILCTVKFAYYSFFVKKNVILNVEIFIWLPHVVGVVKLEIDDKNSSYLLFDPWTQTAQRPVTWIQKSNEQKSNQRLEL